MGCDIHLRVEYRVPGETVGLGEGGEVTVLPTKEEPTWVPAEKLSPNENKDPKWFDLNNPDDRARYESLPEYDVAYADYWYHGRDYRLFGLLAGIRYDHPDQIDEPRDWPDDVSDEVLLDIEGWGDDGHSHSWQTLQELDAAMEGPGGDTIREGNMRETIMRMWALCYEKCNGDPTAVRIVYWFDN